MYQGNDAYLMAPTMGVVARNPASGVDVEEGRVPAGGRRAGEGGSRSGGRPPPSSGNGTCGGDKSLAVVHERLVPIAETVEHGGQAVVGVDRSHWLTLSDSEKRSRM